jgi:hypothetical protein
MINVKTKRCEEDGCDTIPNFNFPAELLGKYCEKHKKQNMINVRATLCRGDDCNRAAIYNLPDEKEPLYCKEHKIDIMINVITRKCLDDDCKKIPCFNYKGNKKALYCNEHKLDNMVNVISDICIYDGCSTQSNFNIPTEKKPLYCLQHKSYNMINVSNKLCQYDKCKLDAIYGNVNRRAQFCNEHKKKDMTNIILYNKCSILDCENEFDFTIDNIKYCTEHCPDTKLKQKKLCKYCDIMEESNWICKDCNKIKNKKEWAIVRYIRKMIDTPFEYNTSKMLNGCSRKRPDIYFELDKHCLIVEIDEHQHNTYEDSCECARLNEIVSGIGGKSVIIIRYNPDVFKNKGKIVECDVSDKLGLLIKIIKKELVRNYDTFIVKIIQLFYDDDYEKYKFKKVEDITDLVAV